MFRLKPQSSTVFLIGRRVQDNDNLALGYLQAALEQEKIRVQSAYINSQDDILRTADKIMRTNPCAVGISLSDGGSAMMMLAVGELLHRHGYRGHITLGGPFATLARNWLMNRYPWIDSVIRFAGEVPLVALVKSLLLGKDWQTLPGITSRDRRETPAPVMDRIPLKLSPRRTTFNKLLGYNTAQLSATRGCTGRCAYCGPAALQNAEYREGVQSNISSAELKACGVGAVRRRSVDHICNEMAELWHKHNVRYFYFVDEHMLPHGETDAIAFLRTLKDGLRQRRVGALGIGTMLRAQMLTPGIVAEFASVGLVRCFIGLELGSKQEGRKFGRVIDHRHNMEILRHLHQHGVATISNLMLVHPYATKTSIQDGITLLGSLSHGLFEGTRMAVYHGTHLHKRLAAQNRLSGNPFRYGYRIQDETAERFMHILTRLRAEAFGDYSISYQAHDVELALYLQRRIAPETIPVKWWDTLHQLKDETNRIYLQGYQRALDLAAQEIGFSGAAQLIVDIRAQAATLSARLEKLYSELTVVLNTSATSFSPMKHAAAAALTFVMLGGTQTGCDRALSPTDDTDTIADTGSDTNFTDTETNTGFADSETGSATEDIVCNDDALTAEALLIQQAVLAEDACATGYAMHNDTGWMYQPTLALDGSRIGELYVDCNGSWPDTTAKIEIADDQVPCTIDNDPYASVSVVGGRSEDITRMDEAIEECPTSTWGTGFTIYVNESGQVEQVTPTHSGSLGDDEVASCIASVLEGLTFPCIAGYQVCSEFIIVE